jgi:hypothetical protein
MEEISSLAKELLAPEKGLCFMEYVKVTERFSPG